ncbi:MAG: class I adenylate-forming enzyme family protein [Pseudomonadales bacterium]|jgi:long-chain acyl-CoA synthetase|tara:strand:- start:32866 stop:34560 length:1695 start_codon:yes stop_codon:yes gene_type:complete
MNQTRAEAIASLTAEGMPYALESGLINGRPCRFFTHAPRTLGQLFADNVSDKTFLVYEDERLSFSEVYDQAMRLANALASDFGVEHGDRVAISMRNYPEWVISFMAVTAMGGVAVCMNALWQTDEIDYGLRHSGSKVFIADEERLARIAPIAENLGIQIIGTRYQNLDPNLECRSFSALLAQSTSTDLSWATVSPDDYATIFYTSGSTGHPKGAVSCHRNIMSALFSWELDLAARQLELGVSPPPATEQPATLLAVPLFHATGSHGVFLQSYRAQRKMVSMYRWDPMQAVQLIGAERITSFVAPAAMTGDLIEAGKQSKADLSSLLSVGGGGAPRAPAQVKNIPETFKHAQPSTGWGMTETNAIGTGIGGEDYLLRPASSGRCSAVLDMLIVDDTGKPLPAGARGELRIRGASVIDGYWMRPEANAEAFEDGWLKTGDVAYLDDEGYLFIVDRIKDLVIRGGENIGCAEVEAALLALDPVLEASVYAVPDARLGEEVGATLYTQGDLDITQIQAELAEHIAKFKIPRYIHLEAKPLPRIASGKIDKRTLRASAAARLGLTSEPV